MGTRGGLTVRGQGQALVVRGKENEGQGQGGRLNRRWISSWKGGTVHGQGVSGWTTAAQGIRTVGTFTLSGTTSVMTPFVGIGDSWQGRTVMGIAIIAYVVRGRSGRIGELGYIAGGLGVATTAWAQGQGTVGVVIGIAAITNATIWYWIGLSGEGSTVGTSTIVGVLGIGISQTGLGAWEGESTDSTGAWPAWVILAVSASAVITSQRKGTQARVRAGALVTSGGIAAGVNELALVIIVIVALWIPAYIRRATTQGGTSTSAGRERQAQGIYECGPRAESEHSQHSQPANATDESQLFLSLDLPIASALLAQGQAVTALALIAGTSQTSKH
jgi:hypothetical protein